MKKIKIKIQMDIELIGVLRKIAVYWVLLNILVQNSHGILSNAIL